MNYQSKIEAYSLLRKGDYYLILNMSDEYNDKKKTVNVKETNRHDNLEKKKKNIFMTATKKEKTIADFC